MKNRSAFSLANENSSESLAILATLPSAELRKARGLFKAIRGRMNVDSGWWDEPIENIDAILKRRGEE